MNSVGVSSVGRKAENPKIIQINVDADSKDLTGMQIEIDTKGYAYSPDEPPSRLVRIGETHFWGNHYKKIDKNWYLYHSQQSGHPN